MSKQEKQLAFSGGFEASNSKTYLNHATGKQDLDKKLPDVPKNQLGLEGAFVETLDGSSFPPTSVGKKLDPDTEKILDMLSGLKFIKKDAQKAYSTRRGHIRLTFLNNSLLKRLNVRIDNRIRAIYVAQTPVVIRKTTPFETFTFTVSSGQRVFMCPRLTKVPKSLLPEMAEKLKANVK